MKSDKKKRDTYRMQFFRYDHPFNEQYDAKVRKERQYVDLQPSVDPTSGRLLALLVRLTGAMRVLELGTSIGYSAHWLASALEETGGTLTTVDFHPRTAAEASENFKESGISDRVEFINEDVRQVLPRLANGFDLIFMDCGKGLYPELLDEFHRLLRPGGLLAVDDTLFPVEQGVRAGLAAKVDSFNRMLKEDERFYEVMLDIGHGLSLATKK